MEFLLKKLSDKIFAQCYLLMLVVLRGAPPVFVNLLVLVNNRHGESLKKKRNNSIFLWYRRDVGQIFLSISIFSWTCQSRKCFIFIKRELYLNISYEQMWTYTPVNYRKILEIKQCYFLTTPCLLSQSWQIISPIL